MRVLNAQTSRAAGNTGSYTIGVWVTTAGKELDSVSGWVYSQPQPQLHPLTHPLPFNSWQQHIYLALAGLMRLAVLTPNPRIHSLDRISKKVESKYNCLKWQKNDHKSGDDLHYTCWGDAYVFLVCKQATTLKSTERRRQRKERTGNSTTHLRELREAIFFFFFGVSNSVK